MTPPAALPRTEAGPRNPATQIRLQRGAVLIASLLILLVLTLLAISAMRTSVLEERMAGNLRDRHLAFEAAESALRDGEAWLGAQVETPVVSADGTTGVWTAAAPDPVTEETRDWWAEADAAWWADNGTAVGGLAGLADDPDYLVEELTFVPDSLVRGYSAPGGERFYQITARGVGMTPTARVLVQSTFVRRFD